MLIERVIIIHALYFIFYTGYDKKTKSLNSNQLFEVLLCRKSFNDTIVEVNKVLALAGLTLAALSVFVLDMNLLMFATIELVIHGAYSSYQFYGSNNIPKFSDWSLRKTRKELSSKSAKQRLLATRKFSIISSVMCSIILEAWFLGYVDMSPAVSLMFLSLGVAHFYSMEVDFRGKLHVRPFGFLAFIASFISIAATAYYWYKIETFKISNPSLF